MLSKNITRLRKSKGLTQVEFSKQLHVTQSAVSHWESGRSVPDTVQLFNIAQFFGTTIEELSSGVAPAPAPPPPAKENTPADMRSEAKQLLEAMNDEQYQEALRYLKYLRSTNEK